jgi:hypothetical protein
MASILVRGLDRRTIERLRKRARIAGCPLQEEVKAILERAADTLTMREARRLSEGGHAISASDHSRTARD